MTILLYLHLMKDSDWLNQRLCEVKRPKFDNKKKLDGRGM